MAFKMRTTKPEAGNKYYIRKADGGYSNAIQGQPTDPDCNVLSNCVGYAYGRFNEIGQWGYCKYLAPVNAENFIQYKGSCEVGQEPKLGACMVWQKGNTLSGSDGAGHVAIVEKIVSADEIVTSESGWNASKPFWTQTRKKGNGNWGANSSYKFLGFIYNPAVPDSESVIPPSYVGYLDTASATKATGWAWNSIDDTSLNVDVKVHNSKNTVVKTYTGVANVYREDLKKAGKGNGKHGFSISIDVASLGSGTYTVKAFTNGKQLSGTKTVTVEPKPTTNDNTFSKNEVVMFTGTTHYSNINAASGPKCKPGKAVVTDLRSYGKHLYHLKAVQGGGSTVYGWVDTKDIQKIQSTVTSIPKLVVETIDKNDIVEIKPGSTWYSGKKIGSWVIKKQWIVREVSGNRVVIDKSTDGKNSICSPIHINNLKLIKKK